MNPVQNRLPFSAIAGEQIRNGNLACAFEPGVVATHVAAVLFESVAERGLMVALDKVQAPQKRRCFGAQCLNRPYLDVDRDDVCRNSATVVACAGPELSIG